MEKGLFNSLFILIMLVMFVPSISLLPKTQNIMDTKYQIEEVAFTSDSVIADALSDQTYLNTCSLAGQIDYDLKIISYLTNFENQRQDYSTIWCSYSNLSADLSVNNYSGSIDITCSSSNEITSVSITKVLYFDKKINATMGATCDIQVIDNLNGGVDQVNLSK